MTKAEIVRSIQEGLAEFKPRTVESETGTVYIFLDNLPFGYRDKVRISNHDEMNRHTNKWNLRLDGLEDVCMKSDSFYFGDVEELVKTIKDYYKV